MTLLKKFKDRSETKQNVRNRSQTCGEGVGVCGEYDKENELLEEK